jgi:hypothetical protein
MSCTPTDYAFAVYAMGLLHELFSGLVVRATCAALRLPVECLLLSSAFSYSRARFAIALFVDSSRFCVDGALAK